MNTQKNILSDSEKIPFGNLKNVVSGVLSEQGKENTPENLEKILAGKTDFLKARIFDAMGWKKEAEQYYLKISNSDSSRKILSLEELIEQAKAKLNLGILYSENGQSDLAIELLQSVSTIALPWIQNKAFLCLGELYSRQGEDKQARKAYKEAKKTGDQKIQDLANQKLGKLY